MTSTTARFWREIPSRYNLIGSKCGNCNKTYFPQRILCPDCHRKSVGKMSEHRFPSEGKVATYTVVHNAPSGFEMQVPYIMAIVKLDEDVSLTAQIVDCKPEDVEIGMTVRAVFRRIGQDGKDGAIHYGYKFIKSQ